MNKKNIVLQTLVFAFLCILSFAEEKEKPNVVFIIVDDLNDWIGVMGGHPQTKTPNLDALAEDGVLFTNAHCNAPQCGPPGKVFCMVFIRRVLAGISIVQKGCLFMVINRRRGSLHPTHQRTLSFFTSILRNMDTGWYVEVRSLMETPKIS